MTQGLPGPFSVCNSAASLTAGLWTTVSSDEEQWVRPGICLYGSSPFEDRLPDALGLRPAMTLAAQLISVREIPRGARSEEHTSELQSLMRISYAVFCLKKKKKDQYHTYHTN